MMDFSAVVGETSGRVPRYPNHRAWAKGVQAVGGEKERLWVIPRQNPDDRSQVTTRRPESQAAGWLLANCWAGDAQEEFPLPEAVAQVTLTITITITITLTSTLTLTLTLTIILTLPLTLTLTIILTLART